MSSSATFAQTGNTVIFEKSSNAFCEKPSPALLSLFQSHVCIATFSFTEVYILLAPSSAASSKSKCSSVNQINVITPRTFAGPTTCLGPCVSTLFNGTPTFCSPVVNILIHSSSNSYLSTYEQERSLRVYSRDRDPKVCAALNRAIDNYRKRTWGNRVRAMMGLALGCCGRQPRSAGRWLVQ